MRLIRFFYQPYATLGDCQRGEWGLPFVACLILSLLTNLLLVNAIGSNVILNRTQGVGSEVGTPTASFMIYTGRPFIMTWGLCLISLLIWVIFRILHLHAEGNIAFVIILCVCSYAAYARETARLLVTSAVIGWHRIVGLPITAGEQVRTNLGAFVDRTGANRLFILARSLDALLLGFLILIMLGLWRAVPGLPLKTAAFVTLLSWIAYVILAMAWGR